MTNNKFDNELSMQLRMNQNKQKSCNMERAVLNTLYIGSQIFGRGLTFNEILRYSMLKKPSLQTVLKRLIKRGWMTKYEDFLLDDGPVEGMHFQLLVDKDDEKKAVFRHILDEFNSKVGNLRRTKITGLDSSDQSLVYGEESFKSVYEKMNSRKRAKFLRKSGIPFKGQTHLLKKILSDNTPERKALYRLFEYPFLFGENESVPQGARRFWESSAKKLAKISHKFKISSPLQPSEFHTLQKGKTETSYLTIIERKDGKIKLRDTKTGQIEEIDEHELQIAPKKVFH